VRELVSGCGREKGDCDGEKTYPGGGILVSSLFLKQMVKMGATTLFLGQ